MGGGGGYCVYVLGVCYFAAVAVVAIDVVAVVVVFVRFPFSCCTLSPFIVQRIDPTSCKRLSNETNRMWRFYERLLVVWNSEHFQTLSHQRSPFNSTYFEKSDIS